MPLNRRSFFKGLVAGAAAPVIVPKIAETAPTAKVLPPGGWLYSGHFEPKLVMPHGPEAIVVGDRVYLNGRVIGQALQKP